MKNLKFILLIIITAALFVADVAYGSVKIPLNELFSDNEVYSNIIVDAFAVATIDEGIEVRSFGIEGTILVLGYTCPSRADELNKYSLTQCVFDSEYATKLSSYGYEVSVHIALDTGMHRLGINCSDIEAIKSVYSLPNLKVDGIFSHLCVSDSSLDSDVQYTNKQISAFISAVTALENDGIKVKSKHIQSSYGLLNYPDNSFSYARIGISLFGVDSSSGIAKKLNPSLIPVLSLKSKIIQIRSLEIGEPVSYGRTFVTERNSRIAVLPIGYADGYPRALSGGIGQAIVCGKKVPIVGRVCMDQLMIDVTDVPEATVDTIVTLIGTDGCETITAEEVAEKAGTITNDLLSCLGRRLTVCTK